MCFELLQISNSQSSILIFFQSKGKIPPSLNTRLHLQGKVARRAIVFTSTIFLKPHCANFKTHIVQISKSEHLEHGFAILHLVSVFQNTKISLFDQKCTPARRMDGHTHTIHTSLSLTLSVFREHNSPSGKHKD